MSGFECLSRTTVRPDRVWPILVDVESWPSWTPSLTWIRRLDDGPLRVGSRARVKQPRLRAAVWEVTHLDEAREFTWTAGAGGIHTTGRHQLIPDAGGTRIALGLDQSGALAGLVGRLYGPRIRRYVQLEADGLAAAAEAAAAS